MQRPRDEEELSTSRPRWDEEFGVLAARMEPFGFALTEKRKQRIRRYCELLISWNRRQALLSRRDVGSVLEKHVGASLGALLLATPNPEEKWVDVGTGAGLPGLVLKVWEPAQEITLVESSRKKSVFLQEAVRELGVGPVDVQTAQLEALLSKGKLLGVFDLLLSRAVTDLKTTLQAFGPAVRRGGRIITFKGPAWEEDVEAAASDGILAAGSYRLEQVLCVPWAPGHLLLLRKEAP
jgi:16S rRNA (guanine527-N7)-methyltransferase